MFVTDQHIELGFIVIVVHSRSFHPTRTLYYLRRSQFYKSNYNKTFVRCGNIR